MQSIGKVVRSVTVGAAILAVAGCENMSSVEYHNGDTIAPSAIPYALPKTVLLVTATYTLLNCDADTKTIKISASAAIAPVTAADDEARYYIDYASLRGILQDSSVAVDLYPNGTLKALNATITNQVVQILGAGAGTVLEIAGTVAKGPFASVKLPQLCKDAVQTNVDALVAAQSQLDAAKAKLKMETDAQKIAALQNEIANVTSGIADLKSKLTITVTKKITPIAGDFIGANDHAYPVETTPIEDVWFTDPGKAFFELQDKQLDPSKLQIAVAIDSPLPKKPAVLPDGTVEGFPVRLPIVAHVRVCGGLCPAEGSLQNVTALLTPETDVPVAQLGTVAILELKNGVLQTNTLAVAMAPDGTVSNITFKDSSLLTQFLTTLGQTFTAATGQTNQTATANAATLNATSAASNAQVTATTAANAQSDAVLKAQADCLLQMKAVIAAGGTPKVSC